MTGLISLIVLLLIIALGIYLQSSLPKKMPVVLPPVKNVTEVLTGNVRYYQKLNMADRERFEQEVESFLQQVRITGVDTDVTDEERILVAASGVIPIFGFPGWHYPNLNEVLLYPGTFTDKYDFKEQTPDHNIMGMVGSGAMNRVMILSKPALHEGFSNKTDKNNTAVHEFSHLVDKVDGDADGIPEYLIDKKVIRSWVKLIHQEIQSIKENESDINPYGSTNEAEFFAVVSEYFFERPLLLEQKHPELFAMLEKIFHQSPQTDSIKS